LIDTRIVQEINGAIKQAQSELGLSKQQSPCEQLCISPLMLAEGTQWYLIQQCFYLATQSPAKYLHRALKWHGLCINDFVCIKQIV
jgi:hypothetical protein